MSIFASILRSVYKLSGAKKAFALPEDALRKEIEKQNRHRGVFTPTDRKAYYETIAVNGFPCLIVREHLKPSERAILYFFGGGMVIGPDKGDLPVMRKLCRETGCDVWFPGSLDKGTDASENFPFCLPKRESGIIRRNIRGNKISHIKFLFSYIDRKSVV